MFCSCADVSSVALQEGIPINRAGAGGPRLLQATHLSMVEGMEGTQVCSFLCVSLQSSMFLQSSSSSTAVDLGAITWYVSVCLPGCNAVC